jgi:hypothetical protein
MGRKAWWAEVVFGGMGFFSLFLSAFSLVWRALTGKLFFSEVGAVLNAAWGMGSFVTCLALELARSSPDDGDY